MKIFIFLAIEAINDIVDDNTTNHHTALFRITNMFSFFSSPGFYIPSLYVITVYETIDPIC